MRGSDIKKYLKERGIRYMCVADKAGLTPIAFSEILRDERRITGAEYYRICKAIGVPVETFFKGNDSPT